MSAGFAPSALHIAISRVRRLVALLSALKKNIVSRSSPAGIRLNVIATGNVLKDNTVMSNVVGIEFLVTPTGSATGNDLKGNTLATNGCGLKGPTTGEHVQKQFVRGERRRHVLLTRIQR